MIFILIYIDQTLWTKFEPVFELCVNFVFEPQRVSCLFPPISGVHGGSMGVPPPPLPSKKYVKGRKNEKKNQPKNLKMHFKVAEIRGEMQGGGLHPPLENRVCTPLLPIDILSPSIRIR